jgi:endonuclease-3
MGERARASEIYERLEAEYPTSHIKLEYRSPFELLIATILAAQTTDVQVNKITPQLFERWPGPAEHAGADPSEVQEVIRSTGFYRNKQKSIQGAARMIVEEYDGRVPDTMDELVRLPGVARKTANIVLGDAFGKAEGIAVDTHVKRLSKRLGLTEYTDPVRIERDLVGLFDRDRWAHLNHLLVDHGRAVCDAKRPRCGECVLAELCPSAFTV